MKIPFSILPLFVGCAFFAQTSADDCQQELDGVSACMSDQLKKIIDIPEVSTDQLKQDIKSCFIDAGCSDPLEKKRLEAEMSQVPKELTDRLALLRTRLGAFQPLNAQMLESAKTCGLQLKDTLQPKLLECMRKREGFENIEWPEDVDMKEDGEKEESAAAKFVKFIVSRGETFFKQKKFMNQIARTVYEKAVCATDEKREQAKKCISEAVDRTIPTELKCLNLVDQEFLIMDKQRRVCDAHVQCMDKLSSRCAKVAEDIPRVTCECSAEIVEENFDELISTMEGCMQDESGKSFGLTRNPVFGALLKRVSTQAMKQICSRLESGVFDPCRALDRPFDMTSQSNVHVQQIHVQQFNFPQESLLHRIPQRN